MYHIANDQREWKSASKLAAAAERLLLDRDPQKLTVSLLSAEAGVSRSTFYRLFDEPADVLQYAVDVIFHDLVQSYVDLIKRAEKLSLSVPNPRAFYEDGVRKYSNLIAAYVRAGKSDVLRSAHKKALLEFAPVLYPDLSAGSEELRFFVELRAAIFAAGMVAWVETGANASIEDVSRYVEQQVKFFADKGD